jgi:S-adenosylmethionine:tRNA ribosyltransferase-isomerase
MEEDAEQLLVGSTQIIIAPGYTFKMVDVLVTNFHQPEITLILLIAAFVGNNWREIYNHALNNNYRFLSYGDSSVLFKNVD